jgi:hypothetical protein
VDGVLRGSTPLPRLGILKIRDGVATATVESPVPLKQADLHYTADGGPWQKRHWETVPATLKDHLIEARLPAQRPLVFYLSVTNDRGLRASTEHEEWKE